MALKVQVKKDAKYPTVTIAGTVFSKLDYRIFTGSDDLEAKVKKSKYLDVKELTAKELADLRGEQEAKRTASTKKASKPKKSVPTPPKATVDTIIGEE